MAAYTIQEAKQEIKSSIEVYLKKDENGNYVMREVNRLPFFLQGPPGIGKTEAARQIAEELGIGFVSLSITHHTRNSVLGLPVIQTIEGGQETKYTEYTMSEMIALVEKKVSEGYSEGILLVDEFSCMAESLVAPMLAFLQTKNIGTHRLPEGWVMLLCSNPPEYNKSARSFDMAVMDRVRKMDVTFSAAEFINYGKTIGIHEDILNYLKLFPKNTHICMEAENGEKIIVTTRGWENLSWCLKGYESNGKTVTRELIRQFIKSEEISSDFFRYYMSEQSGIRVEEVGELLAGKNLSRFIDHIKPKSYQVRLSCMGLLENVLKRNSEELALKKDILFYVNLAAEQMKKKENYGEWIERCIDGERIGGIGADREFSDMEKQAWERIGELYREKGALAVMKEIDNLPSDWNHPVDFEEVLAEKNLLQGVFHEAVNTFLQEENEKMKPLCYEISEKITHAIEFLEAIEGKDNLTGIFLNRLNQSEGILDAMAEVKNPLYLKYCKKVYGMEGASFIPAV